VSLSVITFLGHSVYGGWPVEERRQLVFVCLSFIPSRSWHLLWRATFGTFWYPNVAKSRTHWWTSDDIRRQQTVRYGFPWSTSRQAKPAWKTHSATLNTM